MRVYKFYQNGDECGDDDWSMVKWIILTMTNDSSGLLQIAWKLLHV